MGMDMSRDSDIGKMIEVTMSRYMLMVSRNSIALYLINKPLE